MAKGSGILAAFYFSVLLVFLALMWLLSEFHKWDKKQRQKQERFKQQQVKKP
jgi:hypothetical protein